MEEKKTPWLTLIILTVLVYIFIEYQPAKQKKEDPPVAAEPRRTHQEPAAPPPHKVIEPKEMPKVIEVGKDGIEKFIPEKKEK